MTRHSTRIRTYTYVSYLYVIRAGFHTNVWYVYYSAEPRGVEEFFVRVEDEDDGTRGASRRVSRLGGSVRVVRFLSVRIGFYRIGSRVFRGRVRTVYCVLGVPNHPYVGGWDGWMEWMECDGMGWNGTRMERDALEPGARARSG